MTTPQPDLLLDVKVLAYCPFDEHTIVGALGKADYSYYFVYKRFLPLLKRIAPVERLVSLDDLNDACRAAVEADQRPIVLLFAPPHQVPVAPPCPVIPVFAWEFDTIPDEHWEDEPRHNWAAVLSGQPAAITHSQYAVEAVRRRLGEDFDIVSMPAPVFDSFAGIPDPGWTGRPRELSLTGTVVDTAQLNLDAGQKIDVAALPQGPTNVVLDSLVFTSVLNTLDGRKNVLDLVTAFVYAFRDRPDVTLVLKLVHNDREQAMRPVLAEMEHLAPHRCRIVLIHGYLEQDAFSELVRATTFVVNASYAEGQCLPLMEFMSAGKPAIAPDNTAMADYIGPDDACVVRSSPDWTSWPQDPRGLLRCMRYRTDWESLRDAYRSAAVIATDDEAYSSMSRAASRRLRDFCSEDVITARLLAMLGRLRRTSSTSEPSR